MRVREEGDLLHVGRLAVAPDQQQRGLGTALLLAAEELAGAQVRIFALFTGAQSEVNPAERRHRPTRCPDRSGSTVYTSRVKTAISLPNAVYERAERVAARLGLSRSHLYAVALEEYLDQVDKHADPVTEALDRLYAEQPAQDGIGRAAAGRRLIDRGDWQW